MVDYTTCVVGKCPKTKNIFNQFNTISVKMLGPMSMSWITSGTKGSKPCGIFCGLVAGVGTIKLAFFCSDGCCRYRAMSISCGFCHGGAGIKIFEN
jgi:hypothetical protein